MTHIAEATIIQAPPSRADVLDFLSRLPKSKGGYPLIRLKAGLTRGGLRLEHDVEVEIEPPRGETGDKFAMKVFWHPVGTTLLPTFEGTLRFEWDHDYHNTWALLQGNYEPPLGAVGKAFDAVLGERIARTTMRALLDDVRASLEAAIHARDLGTNER